MDTYPAYALQEVEDFRPDVVIVNRGLLNTEWFARYVRDQEGVPFPMEDGELERLSAYKDNRGELKTVSYQILKGWMDQQREGQFNRPITFALTVSEAFYEDFEDQMQYCGSYYRWWPGKVEPDTDFDLLDKSIEGITPDDFSGRWAGKQDRSPIRTLYTKNIVRNVTAAAVSYGEHLEETGMRDDAAKMAQWAEELEKKSEAEPAFTERIDELKNKTVRSDD
jgi:hypothetical protein